MSRCPPPLGPMCWGGRSSICRASSPTVSVLLRQESPHQQKRSESSDGEQAQLALGNSWAAWHRVRAGMEEGIHRCGLRQQGVGVGAGEQYMQVWSSSSVCQLPAGKPGGGRDRQVLEGRASQDPGPCYPCPQTVPGMEPGREEGILVPSEQSSPVTSFSSFLLLRQEACWGLLGSFPSFFILFPLCSPGMVPTHSGISTQ